MTGSSAAIILQNYIESSTISETTQPTLLTVVQVTTAKSNTIPDLSSTYTVSPTMTSFPTTVPDIDSSLLDGSRIISQSNPFLCFYKVTHCVIDNYRLCGEGVSIEHHNDRQ